MDNRTIRRAVFRRCPEVYFISKPVRNGGLIWWMMLAKVKDIDVPIQLRANMPDTALVSHRELLNTLVTEVYDEIASYKNGKRNVEMAPEETFAPLSAEGKKVFDSPEIQFFAPGALNVDPTGKKTDEKGKKKSGIILP